MRDLTIALVYQVYISTYTNAIVKYPKTQDILYANGCFGIVSTRCNCLCHLFSCWMPFLHGDLMVPSRARWLAYPTGWKERSADVGSCSTIRRVWCCFPSSNWLRFEGVDYSIGIPSLYQCLHQCYSQVPQNARYPLHKGVFWTCLSQVQLPIPFFCLLQLVCFGGCSTREYVGDAFGLATRCTHVVAAVLL